MSKDLPYFRFTVSEWMNDDISLETYKVKGVFIDVCSYYWFKNCQLSHSFLIKKFKNVSKTIDILCNTGIIKVEESGDICISFLDQQYALLGGMKEKKQKAGSMGGKQKAINAIAQLKQSSTYKYKDKDNKKDKDKEKDNNPLTHFGTKNYEILKELDEEWEARMVKKYSLTEWNGEMSKFCDHLFDLGDVSKTVKDFKSHYVNLKNKRPDFLSNGASNKIDWEKV